MVEGQPEVELDVPKGRTSGIPWLRLVKIAGAILSVLVLAYVLLREVVIHPEKPHFTLQYLTLYDFEISADPSLLSSTSQATVSSRNPNPRAGMYYDSLEVYLTYHDQQVTSRTEIPPTYQGHESANLWSMNISGNSVPLAPYLGVVLRQDWGNGLVAVTVKLDGQVRWKFGVLAKGGYHISVSCPAYLTFGAYNSVPKSQLMQSCNVDFSR